MRSKLGVLLLCSTVSGVTLADVEFTDTVPLELARGLLGPIVGNGDVRLYSDIPDAFPSITVPDNSTLLGSADLVHNQQVVLAAEGDGMAQFDALQDSLIDQGYLSINGARSGVSRTGFVPADDRPVNIPTQFCHDTQGWLTMRLMPGASRTVIHMTFSPDRNLGGYRCSDLANQDNRSAPFTPFLSASPGTRSLQTSLPRMVLPPAASTPSAPAPTMMSSSRDSAQSQSDMTIEWPLEALYNHFGGQIAEQGWSLDTESIGEAVALGAWTKVEGGQSLLGSMRLIKQQGDDYQAVFTVSLMR